MESDDLLHWKTTLQLKLYCVVYDIAKNLNYDAHIVLGVGNIFTSRRVK